MKAIWLFVLSGAGKTTLALLLRQHLINVRKIKLHPKQL